MASFYEGTVPRRQTLSTLLQFLPNVFNSMLDWIGFGWTIQSSIKSMMVTYNFFYTLLHSFGSFFGG